MSATACIAAPEPGGRVGPTDLRRVTVVTRDQRGRGDLNSQTKHRAGPALCAVRMVDEDTFMDLMGAVCAPLTVVTTVTADGRPHGTTVSSFASLSLHPPLVSLALDRGSELLRHLTVGARLGVNVLDEEQEIAAMAFAGRGAGKFTGVPWSLDAGLPRLPGCTGWMTGVAAQHVAAGDHVLLVVRVESASSTPASPLVYARRTFGTHSRLAPASRPTTIMGVQR